MANRFSTLTQYHTIVLAHAVMAALVFLLFIPISVMLVRFYALHPGYAVVYHSQIAIVSTLMIIAIFILGYFAVGPERSLTNPHHGIGVAIFVLFLLQVVGGRLVRHIMKARSLRIMIHQWSGRAIALLGIIQVPLGMTLYGSPKYLFVLFTLWMVFLVLVYFILCYKAAGRREFYMGGARSEGGHTRVTESEYFSDHKHEHSGKWKWLGPLAAGAGLWAFMRRKKNHDRERSRSPSSYRRSEPEVLPSRRGSGSYYTDKYSELPPPQKKSGGGFMKILGGAAAAVGAGKLVSGMMNRRDKNYHDDYSAVSTETPRRNRIGRGGPPRSDFSSDYYTDTYRRGGDTQTDLIPPSANPAATTTYMTRDTRDTRDTGRPSTPDASYPSRNARRGYNDSEYSSYVSPSRRTEQGKSGGVGKGILSGLGMGWLAAKLANRRSKKEDDRLREEEEMRAGGHGPRFTGDGHPSPSRRDSRRPPMGRRATGYGHDSILSETTESSVETRPQGSSYLPGSVPPVTPTHRQQSSIHDIDPATMPPMPPDPHGVLHSEGDSSFVSAGTRPNRRPSERRRRAGERAAEAAAARASSLAAETRSHDTRDRYASPVSVKVKVHDDKDRNVTLRRLTEEEAMQARGRADSESSLSGIDSPSQGRGYRRGSSQRRAERAAESHAEAEDELAPLSPPNPAFARGRRGKDSAYYSGGQGAAASGSLAGADQTVSSLGSGSHGTWSAMSPSPSGPDRGNESAAADNRRRRRMERRRASNAASNTRPTGTDMFD